jgi:hypothetical protein
MIMVMFLLIKLFQVNILSNKLQTITLQIKILKSKTHKIFIKNGKKSKNKNQQIKMDLFSIKFQLLKTKTKNSNHIENFKKKFYLKKS